MRVTLKNDPKFGEVTIDDRDFDAEQHEPVDEEAPKKVIEIGVVQSTRKVTLIDDPTFGEITINEADFDPEVHEFTDEPSVVGDAAAEAELDDAKKFRPKADATPATKFQMFAEVRKAGYKGDAAKQIVADRFAGKYGENGRYLAADLEPVPESGGQAPDAPPAVPNTDAPTKNAIEDWEHEGGATGASQV